MKAIRLTGLFLLTLAIGGMAACCKGNPADPAGGGEDGGKTPGRADKIVMYEAYPGMFGQQDGLNGIVSRLNEIHLLGVNVLWLMPLFEEGTLKGVGSPYCIRDYKKVNSDYGDMDDVKALVSAAHAKGMRVIFDWVANHTSWDSAWITEHPEWYSHDANGNIISPPGFNWNDVADLNFDNADMRAAMLDAMKWWITEAGIDGYRCDHADGVPLDFWEDAIAELRKLKGDDLLMLAESGDAGMFDVGFDMAYGWDFAFSLQNLYKGGITVGDLYRVHTDEYSDLDTGRGQHRLRHTTNHDMNSGNSIVSLYGTLRGAFSAWVIAATMGGDALLYGSQEIGWPERLNFFDTYGLDWSINPDYLAEYKKFMTVRAAEDALQASGGLVTYDVDPRVACYKRTNGKEEILIVVNTSSEAKTISLPMNFALTATKDLMTGSGFTTDTTLTLDGYEYKLLKR